MKNHNCGDCGIEEGRLHERGCDAESCPFCGGQLISCDCCYKLLHIDCSEGTWTYSHGLTRAQSKKWEAMLKNKGRVPYVVYPNLCGRCGKLWPEMFRVPDGQWESYVPIRERRCMLCRPCFDEIKKLIDAGTIAASIGA